MDLGFKGRVAIVTGASRGIGKAIALALAAEGAETVLAAQKKRELDETASEIGRYGPAPLTVAVDLGHRKLGVMRNFWASPSR